MNLPTPAIIVDGLSTYREGWSEAQVRAIVAEAVRVALEQAARVAETPVSGEQDDITMQAKDRAAAAIRALKGTP